MSKQVWDDERMVWRGSEGVHPSKAVRVTVHFETVLPIEGNLDIIKTFKQADGTIGHYVSSSAIVGYTDFLQMASEEAGGGDGGDTREVIDVDYTEFDAEMAKRFAEDPDWSDEDVEFARIEWLEDTYLVRR